MKKIITICTIIVLTLSFQNLSARIKYPGKRHTTSHGGTYKSGKGSSHKGGTYKNAGYYGLICASHFGRMVPAITVQMMPL